MRRTFGEILERGRDRASLDYGTEPGTPYGRFRVRCPETGALLTVVAGDGGDWKELGLPGVPWEHVSVSTMTRCPTWEEMVWVKGLFWDDEECVVQYHPPRSEYVNAHPYCLHLWKPVGVEVIRPPAQCVGPKGGQS